MHPFGLDISDSWIRLAVLEKSGSKMRLPIRGEIAVPSGVIHDGEIIDTKVVGDLLVQLLHAAGLRQHRAIVALPERHTFVKLISLPTTGGASVAEAVRLEAAQHLPYAWEDIYADWHVLPQKNSLGHSQAIIAAVPKALVNSYMSVLALAKVEPISLEIESLAVARAVIRPEQERGAHIVLDLGRSRSTLILLNDGAVQFTSTLRYAGKELNHFIADELHVTEEQAEKAKTLFGLDPKRGKGLLRQVLGPHLEELSEKISEVESFYTEHFIDHQPITSVILTGSGAMLRGIDQELSAYLRQPVVLQPSWVYEQLLQTDPDLPIDLGYTYTTAFGLALENFSREL